MNSCNWIYLPIVFSTIETQVCYLEGFDFADELEPRGLNRFQVDIQFHVNWRNWTKNRSVMLRIVHSATDVLKIHLVSIYRVDWFLWHIFPSHGPTGLAKLSNLLLTCDATASMLWHKRNPGIKFRFKYISDGPN